MFNILLHLHFLGSISSCIFHVLWKTKNKNKKVQKILMNCSDLFQRHLTWLLIIYTLKQVFLVVPIVLFWFNMRGPTQYSSVLIQHLERKTKTLCGRMLNSTGLNLHSLYTLREGPKYTLMKKVFNYTPSVEVTQHNVMCTQAATIAFYLSSRIQYLMGVFPVNFRTSSFITFSLKTVCKTPCPAFLNQHQSERGIWASPHIRGAQTSHQ